MQCSINYFESFEMSVCLAALSHERPASRALAPQVRAIPLLHSTLVSRSGANAYNQ